KQLDNKYISVILLALGIVFSIWMLGFNPSSILQGILCWGVAIGANQVYKQLKDGEKQ
ncbi:TPA: phage holin family protein, partial [Clostridioides difficile]|nr:phage holin family protein [Clostridioides difficile]